MGNLGWYQLLTSAAKKVGGPKVLVGLLIGGGAVAGGGAVLGYDKIKKTVDQKIEEKKKIAEAAKVHICDKEGTSNEGLTFSVGDKFKILELDGDAALIEKQDKPDVPFFVSAKFLASISDYVI